MLVFSSSHFFSHQIEHYTHLQSLFVLTEEKKENWLLILNQFSILLFLHFWQFKESLSLLKPFWKEDYSGFVIYGFCFLNKNVLSKKEKEKLTWSIQIGFRSSHTKHTYLWKCSIGKRSSHNEDNSQYKSLFFLFKQVWQCLWSNGLTTGLHCCLEYIRQVIVTYALNR